MIFQGRYYNISVERYDFEAFHKTTASETCLVGENIWSAA